MSEILEAVPNFSEGRDPAFLKAIVDEVSAAGAEVLDASSDADHNRSVVTFIGDAAAVTAGAEAAARVALDRIDLNRHHGVHPRIGALDVMPIVPLHGTPMSSAVTVARQVGHRIAELGIPVFWYAEASDPIGRRLSEIRRGGFEAFRGGYPEGRMPDLTAGQTGLHPTAGGSCVGARPILLAWNVVTEGVPLDAARELASRLRETSGGHPGLRVLAFHLESRDAVQISMNLEDVERRDPWAVFHAIEESVGQLGGGIIETEVIGMIPDPLVLSAAANRLRLYGVTPSRLLSRRVAEYRTRSADPDTVLVADWIEGQNAVPPLIREAAARMRGPQHTPAVPGDNA